MFLVLNYLYSYKTIKNCFKTVHKLLIFYYQRMKNKILDIFYYLEFKQINNQ